MLWIFLVVLALTLAADWLAIRDWHGGPFIGDDGENAATLMLGPSAKNASNAVLPLAAFASSALALSVVLAELRERVHGGTAQIVELAQTVVGPAVVVLMALCVCVFLFMRPRFLVPPPLRGRPGYLRSLFGRRRS